MQQHCGLIFDMYIMCSHVKIIARNIYFCLLHSILCVTVCNVDVSFTCLMINDRERITNHIANNYDRVCIHNWLKSDVRVCLLVSCCLLSVSHTIIVRSVFCLFRQFRYGSREQGYSLSYALVQTTKPHHRTIHAHSIPDFFGKQIRFAIGKISET